MQRGDGEAGQCMINMPNFDNPASADVIVPPKMRRCVIFQGGSSQANRAAVSNPSIEPCGFTIEDHLWVERAIEEHAYNLWRSDHCDTSHSLDHWLQAEAEVLTSFLGNRIRPQ